MPAGKKGVTSSADSAGNSKAKGSKSSESYQMAEFLSGFVCYKELQPEVPEEAIKEEPTSTDASSSTAVANSVPVKPKREYCGYEGCRKTCDSECVHRHCFNCCLLRVEDTFCKCHGERKKKMEEENKFIEEMLFSNSKRAKTTFYHFEERFMKYGETVVIWCMSDFCANRKQWSGDTFSYLEGIKKRELQHKRRNNIHNHSIHEDKSNSVTNGRRKGGSGGDRGGKCANAHVDEEDQEEEHDIRVKKRRFRAVPTFRAFHDRLFTERLGGQAGENSGFNALA